MNGVRSATRAITATMKSIEATNLMDGLATARMALKSSRTIHHSALTNQRIVFNRALNIRFSRWYRYESTIEKTLN